MDTAPTFIDSEDESLLLDDHNASLTKCWKCKGTGTVKAQWVDDSKICINHDDCALEDSPLLEDDQINNFGHLSLRNFHCHSFSSSVSENKSAFRILCSVSILCFCFMITEIIGGYIAGSLAVMTDAAHLFSDVIGFLVSIISMWIGAKPKTHNMNFGYHRVEVLGALISVLFVWLLAVIFCILAVKRIIHKELDINADAMIVIAIMGVVFNLIMGAILHGSCCKHQHSHNLENHHSHSHNENINVRAAAAHVLGDLLQSFGVLVAAMVIKMFPAAAVADPICTITFSAIVVAVTFKVAKDSVLVLIEASPCNTLPILCSLRGIRGVRHVHSLKIWSLAPHKEAVVVHLAIDDENDRDVVYYQATNILKKKLNVVSCTIQVESFDSEQISVCTECQEMQH